MSANLGHISKNHGFLDWWIEAVIVEYVDCRSFAGEKEIWEFNFDQVSEDSIHRAVTNERVVVHGVLFHNVHNITWKMRAIRRMVSAVPVPLSMSPCDAIPEGPVSPYHFPFLGNPIEVWDPKLNFSSHFQVLDDGQLWQWKIAEFVSVDGRGYGKWVCPEIDLGPLDEVAPRLAELRNPPVRPGQEGHAAFETRVRDFYLWLERLREPIRHRLYQIHLAKRASYQGPTKQVAYVPPILSQFEDFTVRDGKILTRFHAEPIFFRAMVRHCRVATKLSAFSEKTSRLDQIYQERVQAVISAAACLEAFVNSVGADQVPSWELYDKLSPEAKWHLCLTVHRQHAQFDPGREPYQTFGKIVDLRNRWLHYRKPLEPVRETKSEAMSWIEAKMSEDFIAKLPARVSCLICELCEAIKQPAPAWLK